VLAWGSAGAVRARLLHGRQVGRGVELGEWDTGGLAVSGSDAGNRLRPWSATREAKSRGEHGAGSRGAAVLADEAAEDVDAFDVRAGAPSVDDTSRFRRDGNL